MVRFATAYLRIASAHATVKKPTQNTYGAIWDTS
jgi:hypothetical protein